MNGEEYIARYGEVAYERVLEQKRAYYKEHRGQIIAAVKKYREEHPNEVAACKKKYYEEHKEKVIARVKKHQEEHPEKIKAKNKKYREENPEKIKARKKKYREEHQEQERARDKRYREQHPEVVLSTHHEGCRRGGKYYEKHLKDNRTGLQGARNKIRGRHSHKYKPYKMIIAPESQLHHEWVPDTSEYRGLALVEKDQHMHGIVDVIEILDGTITLLTEEEVRKGKKNEKEDI